MRILLVRGNDVTPEIRLKFFKFGMIQWIIDDAIKIIKFYNAPN